jgi:hypothetical protein
MKLSVKLPPEIASTILARAASLGWPPEKYVAGLCIADAKGLLRGGMSPSQVENELRNLEILLS